VEHIIFKSQQTNSYHPSETAILMLHIVVHIHKKCIIEPVFNRSTASYTPHSFNILF